MRLLVRVVLRQFRATLSLATVRCSPDHLCTALGRYSAQCMSGLTWLKPSAYGIAACARWHLARSDCYAFEKILADCARPDRRDSVPRNCFFLITPIFTMRRHPVKRQSESGPVNPHMRRKSDMAGVSERESKRLHGLAWLSCLPARRSLPEHGF